MDKFFRENVSICNCCTESLRKLIRENFKKGDIIGLTFIEEGVASIAVGTFVKVLEGAVVVEDLLLEDTTSFVPLCDLSSVEKGIPETQAVNSPIKISLTK